MKKFIAIPLLALLSVPAFAGNTADKSYIMEEEEAVYEEGYNDADTLDDEINEERMEERTTVIEDDSSDAVNYNDRTRTNRERHALNTGSDASDDQ